MLDVPLSEVCLCGGSQWHRMVDRVLWCRRCGCLRFIFEKHWHVPLDRAGELSAIGAVHKSVPPPPPPPPPGQPRPVFTPMTAPTKVLLPPVRKPEEQDPPTDPGTPAAKKKDD